MRKDQILKQLDLPKSANDLPITFTISNKVLNDNFIVFENMNVIQLVPGEKVVSQVSEVIL